MNAITTYFFTSYHLANEAKWLRRLLYYFLLYKCLFWCIDFDLFFGNRNMITKNEVSLSCLRSMAYVLFYSGSSVAITFLISSILLSLNGIFFKVLPRLNAFIAWLLVINLNNATYPSLSGGDYLFQQLLFLNIFLSSQKENRNLLFLDSDKAVHNFGVMAIMIQICLVYFIAGLSKFLNGDWMNGIAVAQAFSAEDFSIPLLYNTSPTGLFKFLNYFVMSYQLLFPLLIWFKKTKKWLLLFGVLQHLYIAFIMGLPTFGFIMLISYAIFYFPEMKKSEKTL